MEISLVVLWQVKVHYQINILGINPTSCLKYAKHIKYKMNKA